MRDIIKRITRKLFASASTEVLQDLRSTIHNDLMYETRRDNLMKTILHDETPGIVTKRYTDHSIIVSLTSYGRRVYEVALAIESIMQQTMKANRIVLWLAEDMKEHQLPQSLVLQQERGLEIQYCRDIRSYTKLIPQLKETPNDAIITVDDDILYDYDVLEHLIIAHLQQPDMIHCCRVREMLFDDKDFLLPYNQWSIEGLSVGNNSHYFLTGCGGALYPPYCFDDEVFNEGVFMDICPDADDVWFTAMALKRGTLINKVFTRNRFGEDFIRIPSPLEQGLAAKNMGMSGNDRQIRGIFSKYALFDRIQ